MAPSDQSSDPKAKLIDDILAHAKGKEKKKGPTAKELFDKLDEKVTGNRDYKIALATALSGGLADNPSYDHMFVIGPSGSGKTHLIKIAQEILSIPILLIDAPSTTATSYKGASYDEKLQEFFSKFSQTPDLSVIVVDEFDKLCDPANTDPGLGPKIQAELLTLIGGKKEGRIDTRRSIWILLGAFAYADEMRKEKPRMDKNSIVKYGFKPELLGRITNIVMLERPTLADAVKIVVNHSDIARFLKGVQDAGYTVEISNGGYLDMAQLCMLPDFGYRELPSLLSRLKTKILFEHQPSEKIVVDENLVRATRL